MGVNVEAVALAGFVVTAIMWIIDRNLVANKWKHKLWVAAGDLEVERDMRERFCEQRNHYRAEVENLKQDAAEIASLEEQLETMGKKLASTEEVLDANRTEVHRLGNMLVEANKRLMEREQANRTWRTKYTDKLAELVEYKRERDEWEKELTAAASKAEMKAKQVQQLLDTVAQREKLIEDLQIKLAASRSARKELDAELEATKKIVSKQEGQLRAADSQMSTLKDQVDYVRMQRDGLKEDYEYLKKVLAQERTKAETVKRFNDQGEDMLEALKKNATAVVESIMEWEKRWAEATGKEQTDAKAD